MVMIRRLAAIMVAILAAAGPTRAEPPQIGDIAWPGIDAYCTAFRAGHSFVFDDAETWRFVMFSNFPTGDAPEPFGTTFIRVNGMLREFKLRSVEPTGGFKTMRLATADAAPITAVVTVGDKTESFESFSFRGTLSVTAGGETATLDIEASCGV
jgi:hypothetical protein